MDEWKLQDWEHHFAFIARQSNKDSFLSFLCHQDTECTSVVPRFRDNQSFVLSSGGGSGSSSALGVGSSSASGVGGDGCCLRALWPTVDCCYFPQLQLLRLFMTLWVIVAFVTGDSLFPLLLPSPVDCFLQILLLCCCAAVTDHCAVAHMAVTVAVSTVCCCYFMRLPFFLPFCQCRLLFFHGLLLSPPFAAFICSWLVVTAVVAAKWSFIVTRNVVHCTVDITIAWNFRDVLFGCICHQHCTSLAAGATSNAACWSCCCHWHLTTRRGSIMQKIKWTMVRIGTIAWKRNRITARIRNNVGTESREEWQHDVKVAMTYGKDKSRVHDITVVCVHCFCEMYVLLLLAKCGLRNEPRVVF